MSDEEVEEEEEEADEEVARVYNERNAEKTNKRYHNVINLMVRMSIQSIQIKNTVHVLSI